MNKQLFIIPSLIFVTILSVFFYLLIIDRNPSNIPSALLEKDFPKFESDSLLKNEKFSSNKELKNKTTLVNFFASWCKPCKDEHIYIQKLSQMDGINIIGINYKDSSEKSLNWLMKLGNPYSNIAIDKNGKIAIDWGVYGIPETFIVNSSGIIKYRHVGPITKEIYKKINLILDSTE